MQTVFKHWQTVHGKQRSVLDEKRRRIISRALAAGYEASTLCEAIAGILNSPHHMGENDRSTKYVDIEHCIGSPKRIDHALEVGKHPPRPLTRTARHNEQALSDWVPPEMRHADP